MQIRKNDSVMVISGKERGKTGKVLRVLSKKDAVVIERVNMVKRHSRAAGSSATRGYCRKRSRHSRFQHYDVVRQVQRAGARRAKSSSGREKNPHLPTVWRSLRLVWIEWRD